MYNLLDFDGIPILLGVNLALLVLKPERTNGSERAGQDDSFYSVGGDALDALEDLRCALYCWDEEILFPACGFVEEGACCVHYDIERLPPISSRVSIASQIELRTGWEDRVSTYRIRLERLIESTWRCDVGYNRIVEL